LTRTQPPGWSGYSCRIDAALLSEVAKPLGNKVQVFICGPTPMVEASANGLVQLGLKAGQIRTERFGPTGA
jgi:ferredoxin-NADP reductase